MFVYLITNKINGKRYVGQTSVSIEQRWRQHKCDATKGNTKHLYKAIRKYGFENFEIKPLVIVGTKQEMDRYEQGLIKAWDLRNPDKGYNLTDGGEGCLGLTHSEETRALLSRNAKMLGIKPPSRKGCRPSLEERRQMSERMKGNTYGVGISPSQETRKKLSDANKGKTLSEEHKRKIAISHIGIKPTQETINKRLRTMAGYKQSEESNRKRSVATKGRPKSEETRKRMIAAWEIRKQKQIAAKAELIGGQGR
jgi:group I intron endonuclease